MTHSDRLLLDFAATKYIGAPEEDYRRFIS